MKQDTFRKWLALSLWEDLSPRQIETIRLSSPDPWRVMDEPEMLDVIFAGARHPGRLPVKTLLQRADETISRAIYNGFNILSILDHRYPTLLANTATPPPVLYYKGDVNLLKHPGIAVVGTREPSEYGIAMTRRFTAGLVEAGLAIISGLARGIDSVAHSTALDAGGLTIAVLGCGLDSEYPKRNAAIRKRIESSGCVITEFPWGTEPNPSHFPRRNRIISGLSRGVLIVESTEKSGALNTVKHAVDQNRDVFAIPGPVISPVSRGPIRVIQQGAYAVLEPEDILAAFPRQPGIPFPPPVVTLDHLQIDPDLQPLWDLLDATPVSVDDLISTLRWDPADVHAALLKMELLGLIKQLPGNCYVRAVSPVGPGE
ncbi:MAG TPA: DNA-processing protein DprA [bacterium]|nr:DNA-processing protein DprA [bacterium]